MSIIEKFKSDIASKKIKSILKNLAIHNYEKNAYERILVQLKRGGVIKGGVEHQSFATVAFQDLLKKLH